MKTISDRMIRSRTYQILWVVTVLLKSEGRSHCAIQSVTHIAIRWKAALRGLHEDHMVDHMVDLNIMVELYSRFYSRFLSLSVTRERDRHVNLEIWKPGNRQ